VHGSYIVFCFGTLLCLFATSLELMLLGRVFQGLGMSGPRILAVAIVRDGYAGRGMARIMSFVMAVFIIVPAIAPAIGQLLISIANWRATFVLLLVMAGVAWGWFSLRQPETLPVEARRPLSIGNIAGGILTILRNHAAFGYTVCAGLIFGPFLAYLSLAQQIFQNAYDKGAAFALWFAAGALSIGVASIINSALVERLGMRLLSNIALCGIVLGGTAFCAVATLYQGLPPFEIFVVWLVFNFFCVGLLFGNLNALAMEPLGDMAGLGAAVVGALTTLVGIPISAVIIQSYNGGVTVMGAAFVVSAALCLIIGIYASRQMPAPA